MDCGVAVVGSGVAGLMAAIAAGPETVLFTDGPARQVELEHGAGRPAVAAAGRRGAGAVRRRHAAFGARAARRRPRRRFVGHVEETIACLVDWGLELDRDAHGDVVRRLAGGLSEPRIVSARDQIGPAIMKILLQRRAQRRGVARRRPRARRRRAADGRGLRLTVEHAGAIEHWEARAAVCCTRRHHLPRGAAARAADDQSRQRQPCALRSSRRLGLPLDARRLLPVPALRPGGERPRGVGRCVPESIVNFRRPPARPHRRRGRRDRPGSLRAHTAHVRRSPTRAARAARRRLARALADPERRRPATLARALPQAASSFSSGTAGWAPMCWCFPFLHYYLGGLQDERALRDPDARAVPRR